MCALVLVSTGTAHARSPAGLSRDVARPWLGLQDPSGAFSDYVLRVAPNGSRDRYGEAMLGYALMQVGLRDRDRRVLRSGLRAVTHAAQHPPGGAVVFYNFALASAYNIARTDAAHDAFFRAHRRVWEDRLRQITLTWSGSGLPYFNQYLVEAVATLELARSGLRSTAPRSVLSDPLRARRDASRLINVELPRLAAPYARHGQAIFSDPPLNPLAYHALTLGFLARGLELLGRDATPAGRRLLRRLARASWALTAPDGDLSYWGRSQEQSWTLGMTAYGAVFAARMRGTTGADAERLLALSRRATRRLATYVIGRNGLLITPALRFNLREGLKGVDYYAAASAYNGLTLVGLNWASGESERDQSRADHPPAVSRPSSDMAVVRTPTTWMAVRAGFPQADLRYDSGLVALKLRSRQGWRDVLRLRPLTAGAQDSAGPLLLEGAEVGLPTVRHVETRPDGVVRAEVDFRNTSGTLVGERAIEYRPLPCGASISLPAGAYEYSFFLQSSPRTGARAIRAGRTRMTFSRPGTVSLEPGYTSAADVGLVRARVRFASVARLRITICRLLQRSGRHQPS